VAVERGLNTAISNVQRAVCFLGQVPLSTIVLLRGKNARFPGRDFMRVVTQSTHSSEQSSL
jgi:hypothetical protein